MTKLTIHASTQYDVHIGEGLLESLPCTPSALDAKAVIITDDVVDRLYSDTLINTLTSSGYIVYKYVFPNGESSKNMEHLTDILQFLCANHVSRSDMIYALGGGVVGDMAGFAASIYLRGIRFIQIPTTMLAAVDSSVGGKTAVNLPAGKNLVGSFYQPAAVYCDYSTLKTLPPVIFSDGCGEVIKYGMISDADLFELLHEDIHNHLEEVIATCVSIKSDIVGQDEFDTGLRQLLNFGHTIGHAVELCSNYSITHGSAVAIGMAMITKASMKMGFCDASCYQELISLLEQYKLPINCDFTAEELYRAALSDKKHANGTITLVIPERIGHCILHKTTNEDLFKFISYGLSD